MLTLGPVTTVLEAEVKQQLRNYGIVVWLDKDGTYTPYVDSLADRHAHQDFFAPVIPFRGSYLDLLFALEPYGDKLDPEPLLIHMPGHTEQTITKTPLLELYRAGTRYRRALGALVREAATGKLPPDTIETYVSQQLSDLSEADRWLSATLTAPADDIDHYLAGLSSEWVLDGLLGIEPTFRAKLDSPTCYPILLNYLHRQTGLDDRFRQFYLGDGPLSFQTLGELFAAWLLGVEYANDLTRPPHLDALKPLTQLSAPLLKTCHSLITHLRDRHPKTYIEQANAVAMVLSDEFEDMSAEDLGKIDTFKQEETAILDGAIKALQAGQWQKAHDWAAVRNSAQSFWLKRDRKRRVVWSLVEAAAHLGCLIAKAPTSLKAAYTLREALDLYTQSGHRIDNAHRHLEQKRLRQLDTTLPHFTCLQAALDHLRTLYRQWADTLAEEFTALCEREGFLPEAALQQRTLYEQVVHPLTQAKGKVALFLIDAFRYEMAAELLSQFEGAGTQVSLKGRLAELPTLTAVGMNALAPVSQSGKLVLAGNTGFGGFKTGEYTVRLPKDRARAMGERSVDNIATGRNRTLSVSLGDICTRSTEDLKRTLSPVELVVVHSKEIDDAGEAEVGLASFETWLSQIKAAWNHLK
ncbi:PglZ domain-containing protein, partial [filamentous cyanobacterium CCP3]